MIYILNKYCIWCLYYVLLTRNIIQSCPQKSIMSHIIIHLSKCIYYQFQIYFKKTLGVCVCIWCVRRVGACHNWTQVDVRGQLCRTKQGESSGIIDTCCSFQLYMGSGEPNSGCHTCVTSTLPTNPPKWKFWSSFYYIIRLIMKCPFYSADMSFYVLVMGSLQWEYKGAND